MSRIGLRLEAHWKARGMEPAPGVGEAAVRAFVERLGILLPAEMRDYFLWVDGMGDRGESDDDWFCFWALGEVDRAIK